MDFKEAYELPIGKFTEKKGKFTYLSWAYAVKFLREKFPEAKWTIHENHDGLPIFTFGESHFVKVSVDSFTQWHPVLDYQNKPIKEPDSFQINTAIQRCLTKAIGLATGLGLGLYAGEDLPTEDTQKKITEKQLIELGEICESFEWPSGSTLQSMAEKVYNLKRIEDLPEAYFTDAVDKLNKKAEKDNGTA